MSSITRYSSWNPLSSAKPHTIKEAVEVVLSQRPPSRPEISLDYDPTFRKVAQVLAASLQEKKRILLYADYDVDGTMSCVLWLWFLDLFGYDQVEYFIPTRSGSGYGVHITELQKLAASSPFDVVITMDTGSTAQQEAEWCQSQDILFVATDHHDIQKDMLPQCGYVLNPKLFDNTDHHLLCGCGVTFALLKHLAQELQLDLPPAWLDDAYAITALATVCDVMPLTGINRPIVHRGLKTFHSSNRPILQALRKKQISHLNPLSPSDFGFRIGPLLNAPGRLADARIVVEAFTKDQDTDLLSASLTKMTECSKERKRIDENILERAKSMALERQDAPVLFLGAPDWHPGVLGIVAARLASHFFKPTWLYRMGEETCQGSVRSLPKRSNPEHRTFDVTAAMASCSELFERFGGHQAAAGFTFQVSQKEAIEKALTHYTATHQSQNPDIWTSAMHYDCELPLSLLTLQLTCALDEHGPYGHGFDQPIFKVSGMLQGVSFFLDSRTKEPAHTTLFLEDPASPHLKPMRIVFFRRVMKELEEAKGERLSCLIRVGASFFRGVEKIDLFGLDVRMHTPTHAPLS